MKNQKQTTFKIKIKSMEEIEKTIGTRCRHVLPILNIGTENFGQFFSDRYMSEYTSSVSILEDVDLSDSAAIIEDYGDRWNWDLMWIEEESWPTIVDFMLAKELGDVL